VFHSVINKAIFDNTISEIDRYKDSGATILTDKINMLNNEWDTERILETNAASIIFLSSILGYKRIKSCWFLLTGSVGFFLLQHALQGWCPPLPIIRKLGIRTAEEIYNQRTVYKDLRGDFTQNTRNANEMLDMVEK
jgi:hypothetical protein